MNAHETPATEQPEVVNAAVAQAPEPAQGGPQLTAPATPAPAAGAPAAARRSPGLALALSFFPGLGHLYLGLYQRGIVVFLAFASAIWLGRHADVGILGAFVWFFAVIDAYRQAQLLNQGTLAEPDVVRPVSRLGGRSTLGFGIFLAAIGLLLLYNQFYPIDFSFLETWWPMVLVLAGVYLVARHFLEVRRRQAQDEPPAT